MKKDSVDSTVKKIIIPTYGLIRNIPFEIRIGRRDYCEELEFIQQNKRGSCSSKHYFLGSIFESLGLRVLYLTYPFYWSDLNVDFPNHIKSLAKKMPICYHLAIEVAVKDEKIFLDATWDPPLKKAGFKINQITDEFNDVKNAVNPCGECIIHQSGSERSKYIKSLRTKNGTTNLELEIEFYNTLNSWLSQVRTI